MSHWSLGSNVGRNVLAVNGVQPKTAREIVMEAQAELRYEEDQQRLSRASPRPRYIRLRIARDALVNDDSDDEDARYVEEIRKRRAARPPRYNLERPRLTFGIKPDAGVPDSVAPTAQVIPVSDGCPSELAVAAEPPCAGNALAFSSAPSTPGLESLSIGSSVPPYAVASDGSKRHEYSGHGAVPFPDGHDSGWTARIVKKIHVVIIWDPGGYIYGFHATRHAFVHILLHSSAWSRASTLLWLAFALYMVSGDGINCGGGAREATTSVAAYLGRCYGVAHIAEA